VLFRSPLRLRCELLEHKVLMLDAAARKQSASLLLVGCVFLLLGFVFAFVLGCVRCFDNSIRLVRSGAVNRYCHRYDGKSLDPCYFPSTVSEMVSNPSEPTGKIFFFFEFVGSLFIFFSWYPSKLRNAYIGEDHKFRCVGVSWLTVRQYMPAPGMMMVATIPVVPIAQADTLDYFCISLHLLGAFVMFVGYFLSEAVTVRWGPFQRLPQNRQHIRPRELLFRRWCLHGVACSYVVFCLLQVVLSLGAGSESFDQWEASPPHCEGHLTPFECKTPQLIKSASREVRRVKLFSYGAEVVCGICLFISHFAIWYFCEERKYDLLEELFHINKEEAVISNELELALEERETSRYPREAEPDY